MNSLFSFRFDAARDSSIRDVLMIFSATPHFAPDTFATVVEAELESNLVPDDLLIVVRDTAFERTLSDLSENSQSTATFARLRGRTSVTLVGYNITGHESKRSLVTGPVPAHQVKFEEFKRRAVTHIFNARHGFVESTSTYHFENPSGRHTERFIRLSNTLVRGAEIAFIGFCTLPFIPKGTAVAYLDTPSLYAVVSAINEQRLSLGETAPILADNFSSYAGVSGYQFDQIEQAIVLISASSSGSLAVGLIRDESFAESQVTHVLFLGKDKSGSNIVCDLQRDKLNPEGIAESPAVEEALNCRMCASGSHAIKLQGDQFEFAGPQQEPLLIRKADAPSGLSELMNRLTGGSLLEIGLSLTGKRQPRQFEISTSKLLVHKPFLERLAYVLRRSIPASLSYIISVDDSSEPFAQKLVEHVEKAKVIGREALDSVKGTESAIVIAAAVIESGRCLLDISRDLRTIAPNAPLLYLVGFSKTTAEPRREALERTLIQTVNPYPYQFIEVERMVLPSSAENSAWVAELRLLINPAFSQLIPDELRNYFDARVSRLRKASETLCDDLFLANRPDRNLCLQPGFVFWVDGAPERSHTQADVFFTVASVLQQLRSNAYRTAKSALKSNWFQQTILAPGNFGRFNDDIIQASILRAAFPYEMNFAGAPMESRELTRLISRIISASQTDRGGAAAEFLLAIATRRLRLCPDDTEAILNVAPTGIQMIDLFLTACKVF